MPSVSVVIATFNYERYVGLAISSALDQSVSPAEVIVVDDGSTDGTAAVLARFGDRIRLIEQENRGQVAALQRGFAASRGELVLFLDSDDLLLANAIEEITQAWRPECAKVQFELEIINERGERTKQKVCNYVEPYGVEAVRDEFARFGTYVWPVLSGNAYSRWLLTRLLPLREPAWFIDGAVNTVAPLYGEVRVVTRTLGYRRLHTGNHSYHGFNGESIGGRFAKHVQIRTDEFRFLSQHAAALGRTLPPGNLLDHELLYVNYRLMLKRLGEDYQGAAADTRHGLWKAGLAVLGRRPLPLRLTLSHAVWLTTLLCSPRWLCRQLIRLRYSRARLRESLRRSVLFVARPLRDAVLRTLP